MQNKSAIWVFTILLSLACLYQLSFSVLTGMHEGNAEEYAENKIDSVISAEGEMSQYVQDSTYIAYQDEWLAKHANDEIYPILGFTYKEAKKSEINLGLDLQGGMNVTLEVSVVDLIKALSGNSDENLKLSKLSRIEDAEKGDFIWGVISETLTSLGVNLDEYKDESNLWRDEYLVNFDDVATYLLENDVFDHDYIPS